MCVKSHHSANKDCTFGMMILIMMLDFLFKSNSKSYFEVAFKVAIGKSIWLREKL